MKHCFHPGSTGSDARRLYKQWGGGCREVGGATYLPHLSLLVLGEQGAVEVLQRQLGHGHPLAGVVAHGKGGCRPTRHGHTILGGRRAESDRRETVHPRWKKFCCAEFSTYVGSTFESMV